MAPSLCLRTWPALLYPYKFPLRLSLDHHFHFSKALSLAFFFSSLSLTIYLHCVSSLVISSKWEHLLWSLSNKFLSLWTHISDLQSHWLVFQTKTLFAHQTSPSSQLPHVIDIVTNVPEPWVFLLSPWPINCHDTYNKSKLLPMA